MIQFPYTRNILVIICCMFFLSCSSSIPNNKNDQRSVLTTSDDSIANIALQIIYKNIASTHKNAILKGNTIVFSDADLSLKINVEFNGQKSGQSIYAANLLFRYNRYGTNDHTDITVESIGLGASKEEAQKVFIQEWVTASGAPLIAMLNDEKPLLISRMKVFSGYMGTRGTLPEKTWLAGDEAMTKKIFPQIEQAIKDNPADIIPVDLKLIIGKTGIIDGECRIGNEHSADALNSLKKLDWPTPDEKFLFKQFYLIKKS